MIDIFPIYFVSYLELKEFYCDFLDKGGQQVPCDTVANRRVAGVDNVPSQNSIRCNGRKDAQEKARNAGKGNPPKHHPADHVEKLPAHWHPVGKDGQIRKDGTHFNYGQYS